VNGSAIWAIAMLVIRELCRRKDIYVLFILTTVITLGFGAVNFFNDDQIVRYLKEICLALIWLSSIVIAVMTGARQIPDELERKTIFPLLAKPVSRADVILGKYLGSWLACGVALLVFYLFFGIISATREEAFQIVSCIQAMTMHWFMLSVLIAMTMLGSLVFVAVSSNATIMLISVAGILTILRHLNTVALQQPEPMQTVFYALYFALPHLEFYDMRDLIVHSWPPLSFGVILLAFLYAAFYTALFLVAACQMFKRRSIG
jgi:ABC-type transport system involved in multi-copper enzyme maturation permease subunit